MRILLDMNLAPAWVGVLADAGHEMRHRGEVGARDASDATIMAWPKANGHVVFTHDLDYLKRGQSLGIAIGQDLLTFAM